MNTILQHVGENSQPIVLTAEHSDLFFFFTMNDDKGGAVLFLAQSQENVKVSSRKVFSTKYITACVMRLACISEGDFFLCL